MCADKQIRHEDSKQTNFNPHLPPEDKKILDSIQAQAQTGYRLQNSSPKQ